MKKARCINGHFFDVDRYQRCPICDMELGQQDPGPAPKKPDKIPHTVPLLQRTEPEDFTGPDERPSRQAEEPAPVPPVVMAAPPAGTDEMEVRGQAEQEPSGIGSPKEDLENAVKQTGSVGISPLPRTMAYYGPSETDPPVGWLVCVKGVDLGQAFACRTGRNRIGRSADMEICLCDNPSISRETHAMVIYEPKKNIFYVQAGTGKGLVYHNGECVFDHEELRAYDMIDLGEAKFVFLPLCGERFTWDDYMTKE